MASSISQASGSSVAGAYTRCQFSSQCGVSAEERLLALAVYTQTTQANAAKTSVNLSFEEIEKLRDEVMKALNQAREAKKDGGFWGDLAKIFGSDLASIATAVAAVAAVVATGGAAAAVLAVVAAAATFAADHAKELGIPPEVAMAIAVAASIAGLCCGDAKGLLEVGAKAKDLAKDVKLWANVGAGVASAAGGGCRMAEAQYQHDAGYYQADARRAEGQQSLVSMDIDEALDRLAAALEQQNGAIELAGNIRQQSAASNSFILNNLAGAA